jgi:hypothetical protein
VFAQTAKIENYLIRKLELNTSKTLVLRASENDIKNFKADNKITYFRKIENETYIVVPNANFSEENVSILGNANDNWKLSADYRNKILFPHSFAIEAIDLKVFLQQASQHQVKIHRTDALSNTAIIEVESESDFENLIKENQLVYIKPILKPQEESPNPLQDLSVNRINVVHDQYPTLNGEGLTISIKERTVDINDIDLKNRFVSTELADPVISLHANQIATIIAGGGNSQPSSKGIAFRSLILSSSYDNLLPDDVTILKAHGAYVQNHSYGTAIENFYGPEAKAYDALAVSEPYNLNVFSSGNSGLLQSTEGKYQNIAGYANLSGNMKMAKNVLVVGGHTSLFELDERNSNGPAFDGRIKPELVSFGPEGTSDAAAFVSGVSALIQEKHLEVAGALPTTDLVKAILISSADDIGPSGIDYKTGYGSLNAIRAIDVLNNDQYFKEIVSENSSITTQIQVPAGVKKITFALTWIDPPVNAGVESALANDLDMIVTTPGDVDILPWVLNDYPHVDSLAKPAKRKSDHLNNCEYVTIDNPETGSYSIKVSANDLVASTQSFSVAYSFEYEDSFQFTYPTSSDAVRQEQLTVRWDGTLEGVGRLEASVNDGSFFTIDEQVDLAKGFYSFTPDFSGEVQLKMTQASVIVTGEKFILSPAPVFTVGFVCDQNTMLQWSEIESAETYNVYTMGSLYLELYKTLSDTVVQISNDQMVSNLFAVEPVINGRPGYRTPTYDVTSQGVKCYYKQFYAFAENGAGHLQLTLSTIYNVASIVWERKTSHDFEVIGQATSINTAQAEFLDEEITSGVTEYRAIIVLKSGEEIETETIHVYYADESNYFLFPNPVDHTSQALSVLSDGNDLIIYFYDNTGQIVKAQEIFTPLFYFPVTDMKAGLYLYRIQRGGNWVSSGKILVK